MLLSAETDWARLYKCRKISHAATQYVIEQRQRDYSVCKNIYFHYWKAKTIHIYKIYIHHHCNQALFLNQMNIYVIPILMFTARCGNDHSVVNKQKIMFVCLLYRNKTPFPQHTPCHNCMISITSSLYKVPHWILWTVWPIISQLIASS
jgi:hypothetical protein